MVKGGGTGGSASSGEREREREREGREREGEVSHKESHMKILLYTHIKILNFPTERIPVPFQRIWQTCGRLHCSEEASGIPHSNNRMITE